MIVTADVVPATAEFGVTDVIVGTLALLIVKATGTDTVGLGVSLFCTSTINTPALLGMSFAGIDAVSCVALTNTVDIHTVPQLTFVLAPGRNPVPFTVSVKAPPPTFAEFGLKPVMAALAMLKLTALELTPSAVFTVMGAMPAFAR
jgi:hypothetical protein